MAAQLGNIGVETGFSEQSGNLGTQSTGRDVLLIDRVAQNIPYLFFHAVAISPGATLQPPLHPILDIADNQLRHGCSPFLHDDIMISHDEMPDQGCPLSISTPCSRRFPHFSGFLREVGRRFHIPSLPNRLNQCDNESMEKTFTCALNLLAAGILLLGNTQAQQTPPAKTPAPPAAKTRRAPAARSQAAPALTTQKDKFSYALGMNLGTSLHRQSVPVDPNILLRGLKDALAGGKTQLSEDQAKAALMEVQTEMRKKQQEQMQQAGETNKKEGETFLAANKSKEGVVTLPSGLQYKILTQGTGPKPTASDSVVCSYRGTLINGTEFDSSYKRGEPATFPVSGVIKGWTEALQLMPVGSKWQLFVPSDLAYGERPPGPEIGPDSTLIFEVELLSIQDKSAGKSEDKK
jgi:FKBP-type peptidyl-prolyl cis-trans isomerase FklB